MPYPPTTLNPRTWLSPDKFAEHLRRNATKGERAFFRHRRAGGHKFVFQHVVGAAFIDFACLDCQTAIEVDGSSHRDRTEYDAARTAELNRQGWRVIRFRNDEVLKHPDYIRRRLEGAHCTNVSWRARIVRLLVRIIAA